MANIVANLYRVAERNNAPDEVLAWLWETAGAADRDQRLLELERVLVSSLEQDDEAQELAPVVPLFGVA